MKGRRNRSTSILISINVLVIIAYLISCLLPFINTGESWLLALPGLIFPFIFFTLVFFIILWALLKSKWWWISLMVLVLGFQQIITVFGFNFSNEFSYDKKQNTLRVLQWNVTGWDEGTKAEYGGSSFRLPMLDLVNKQQADILCFQEFFESRDTGYFKSNILPLVKMGFPYYYFVPAAVLENSYQYGVAIFSKFPITDSARFRFKTNNKGEHLIYTDIKVNDKIFRLFTMHLQPLYLRQTDYELSRWLTPDNDADMADEPSFFSRLQTGYQYRYLQADFTRKKINESPHPVIICGDFNDLPNSSVYFKIKGDLQDAFLKKGWGFGRTVPFISPTLRIDYIFADKHFKVTQFKVVDVDNFGTHYPVVTDLQF